MATQAFEVNSPQEIDFLSTVLEAVQATERLGILGMTLGTSGAASTTQFIAPTVEMQQLGFGVPDIPASDAAFKSITLSPLRFVLKTATTEAQMTLSKVNILSSHAEAHGYAGGRTRDAQKLVAFKNAKDAIDTIYASELANFIVPETVGPNTGINTIKLNKISSLLNARAANPMTRLVMVYNAFQGDDLRNEEKYASWFYNKNRPLNDGNVRNELISEYAGIDRYISMADQTNTRIEPVNVSAGVDRYYDIVTSPENVAMYDTEPFQTRIVNQASDFHYTISSQAIFAAGIRQLEKTCFLETKYTNGESTPNA